MERRNKKRKIILKAHVDLRYCRNCNKPKYRGIYIPIQVRGQTPGSSWVLLAPPAAEGKQKQLANHNSTKKSIAVWDWGILICYPGY